MMRIVILNLYYHAYFFSTTIDENNLPFSPLFLCLFNHLCGFNVSDDSL